MSHFVKVLQEHEAEIDRMIAQGEKGTPISYSMMRQMGMLKPFAVRLPVPLIAVLDEVMGHGLWHSKQEMVYHMIQSAYLDFFESSSEDIKSKLDAIQKDAWNAWERKHKGKVFNPMTERYEAKQPTTPKRGKVRGKPKLERVK